jgi:AAA15 family ATPase/GTPase
MLIRFRFKNFKSFRDETDLSMVASADKAHLDTHTISVPGFKHRLLRSAVIYGANASGKTNVIEAFTFLRKFVSDSTKISEEAEIEIDPFALDDTFSDSEFEVDFIHDGIRYCYGFQINSRQVISEWFYAYPKNRQQVWFERHFNQELQRYDWKFGKKFRDELTTSITHFTRPNVLFLSRAVDLNNQDLTLVARWFDTILPLDGTVDYLGQIAARWAVESPEFKKQIRELLTAADIGITDLKIVERQDFPPNLPAYLRSWLAIMISKPDGTNSYGYQVLTTHPAKNEDGFVTFRLEDESRGTQRLFSLSSSWMSTLQLGHVLLVDELGSSLHPQLVRQLVDAFHDPTINTNGAQLIFNTHDTNLLDMGIFRRDQIWFTEKDANGVSHLYPLLDFKARNEDALEKRYLQGRYGGVPIFGSANLLDVVKGND